MTTRWCISAENHVNEPLRLWDKLPAHLQGLQPRIELIDGVPTLLVEGEVIKRFKIPQEELKPDEDLRQQVEAYQLRKTLGMAENPDDPDTRLADLDRDGVWGEVMYPNLFSFEAYQLTNTELQIAGCRLYNDWIADTFIGTSDRFNPVAPLPTMDPEAAVTELRRCARKGFRTVGLPAHWDALPYNHPSWDPLWTAAEEEQLPLSIHAATGRPTRPAQNPGAAVINLVTILGAAREPVLYLTASGVLARHPELKVVIAEGEAGWLAWTLHFMDHTYRHHHMWAEPKLDLLPSEYFRRQCYLTFMEDPIALRLLDVTGDCLMWGSDYPHPEGTWPNSQESIDRITAGLPEDTAQRIIFGNAASVYRFRVPADLQLSTQG